MAIEIGNIIQISDQVHFTATKGGVTYRFAVAREPIDDLAHYRREDAVEDLDRLAVFEDFEDRIAKAAEQIIDLPIDNEAIFILTGDHLCK
jgi:hypothetical protein